MKILAFDTALFGCSVAVLDTDSGACIQDRRPMARGQAELLVPMIDEALARAGIDYAALDLIATTIGPGAFTGLRIGLSTARALGLSLDKPVMGLTTLDVLAAQYRQKETLPDGAVLAVLVETKRKDFYFQYFDAEEAEPLALEHEEICARLAGRRTVFVGDALARFRDMAEGGLDKSWSFAEGYDLTDAAVMARLAATRYDGGGLPKPEPLYLRGADVSVPKRKPREIVK